MKELKQLNFIFGVTVVYATLNCVLLFFWEYSTFWGVPYTPAIRRMCHFHQGALICSCLLAGMMIAFLLPSWTGKCGKVISFQKNKK